MRGWRRRLAGHFVVLFLLLQVAVPAFGLYYTATEDASLPFTWQMFSRVASADGE